MYRRELEVNGTSLSFETGKYAKQADGSVVVRMGDSVVLVTACASPNADRHPGNREPPPEPSGGGFAFSGERPSGRPAA